MQFRLAEEGVDLIDDQGNLLRRIRRLTDRQEWAEYQAFCDAGGTPLPMPTPVKEVPKTGERIARLALAVETYYDTEARSAGFRNLVDALLHTGFPSVVRTKAVAVGQWEVACRVHVDQVRQDVISGARTMPTAAELIAELPALVLP